MEKNDCEKWRLENDEEKNDKHFYDPLGPIVSIL